MGGGNSLVFPGVAGASQQKKNKILLVAAPKKEIQRYEHLASGVDLSVSAIELETFSIARSLVGDDTGSFFIIDIGARVANIILIEKGIVRANRTIDAGGNEITAAIADSMNISRQRAETFLLSENRRGCFIRTRRKIPVLV